MVGLLQKDFTVYEEGTRKNVKKPMRWFFRFLEYLEITGKYPDAERVQKNLATDTYLDPNNGSLKYFYSTEMFHLNTQQVYNINRGFYLRTQNDSEKALHPLNVRFVSGNNYQDSMNIDLTPKEIIQRIDVLPWLSKGRLNAPEKEYTFLETGYRLYMLRPINNQTGNTASSSKTDQPFYEDELGYVNLQ